MGSYYFQYTYYIVNDAKTEYQLSKESATLNPKHSLTADEERRIFGQPIQYSCPLRERIACIKQATASPAKISLEVMNKIGSLVNVRQIETRLKGLLKLKSPMERAPFPLESFQQSEKQISQQYVKELEKSWELYFGLDQYEVNCGDLTFRIQLLQIENEVKSSRSALEEFLIFYIGPPSHNAFLLRSLANLEATVQPIDLLKIAAKTLSIDQFNPILTQTDQDTLYSGIVTWMLYCVLEDKLDRIARLIITGENELLVLELFNMREWDPFEHTSWLIFEVEQRLQIRHVQYLVTKYLLEHPCDIVQLNMGEGKTRIILPMLFLEYGKQKESIVRLNILTELFGEAFLYLHRVMCGSVFHKRLFLFPFNREIVLTEPRIAFLTHQLNFCKSTGGCILVAPEHRNSLLLKYQEMRIKSPDSPLLLALERFISSFNYIDIFDESDELLSNKRQLIYALGDYHHLPGGISRWNAIQGIALLIFRDGDVRKLLGTPQVSVVKSWVPSSSGSFIDIRLIPGVDLDNILHSLLRLLASKVLDDPPYEFLWLKRYSSENVAKTKDIQRDRDALITYMTQPRVGKKLQAKIQSIVDNQIESIKCMEDVLAFRGLLAYGNFMHCLQRRHNVNYGIKKPGKKQMAVPYRAAHTPAERAEFAHPDIALIYTIFSYYYIGLDEGQFEQAMRRLLSRPTNVQKHEFSSWYKISSEAYSGSVSIDSPEMIDLSNKGQFQQLFHWYRYNMNTVFYWLINFVFPNETQQYPDRLIATSWNIADNHSNNVIGFSGTDGNKLLLPLQVKQVHATESLEATNGLMLHSITKNPEYVDIATSGTDSSQGVGHQIVLYAIKQGINVIIDTGALLSGLKNEEFADFILRYLPDHSLGLSAVTYFNSSKNKWCVKDRQGRHWALESSPIREIDTFVFFDESRCRGADMKLSPRAVAIVTVGPRQNKDKTCQGIGRLRQFQIGQTFVFVGSGDVTEKIRSTCSLSPDEVINSTHVLHYISWNTIKDNEEGLHKWSTQGNHFCNVKDDVNKSKVPEEIDLHTLYHASMETRNFRESYFSERQHHHRVITSMDAQSKTDKMRVEIDQRITKFGGDFQVIKGGHDEECERELEEEQEEEVEEEREIEVPQVSANREKPWKDYDVVFSVHSASELVHYGVEMMSFQDFALNYLPEEIRHIPWQEANLFVTDNFVKTVDVQKELNLYLRPLDAFLYYKNDNSILLLSELEANCILEIFWKKNLSFESGTSLQLNSHVYFGNFFNCMLSRENLAGNIPLHPSAIQIPDKAYVLLKLFRGDTSYPIVHTLATENRLLVCNKDRETCPGCKQPQICSRTFDPQKILSSLLRDAKAVEAAKKLLPESRGLSYTVYMSDLETVIKLINIDD